ncbi:MAG: hypothetical protein M1818_005266 [Claussenomyces sp. TS43310]|nr:MAG: hypothetical protein M1818_005266 [Claussenomyces sp. TS43310]
MASMRRMRVMGVTVLLCVITLLWYTSDARRARRSDFYSTTKSALEKQDSSTYRTHPLDDDAALAAAMAARLRDAESVAMDNANAKAPKPAPLAGEKAQAVIEDLPAKDGDRNVAGRKKYPIESEKPVVAEKTPEEHEVEVELNSILKRSPIIIFSKSYCPHSRRAKGILLEKYDIVWTNPITPPLYFGYILMKMIQVPSPVVIELDMHPLGALLQAKLGTMTGRKTVPNVMINGKSIGGGDEVAELDVRRQLVDKIKSMTGKQMQKIEPRAI